MSETSTETTTTEAIEAASTATEEATETATEESTETKEAPMDLGDAGKKAIDRMKADKKAAQDEARKIREEFEAFKAKQEGKEAEHAADLKAREVEQAALGKANERILKAEVRAAGATKLNDPADALRFIDLSEFEVGSDGEVDADAINAAIDDLITSKPYLAAQGGPKFKGSSDGGTRNESGKPIDEQIAEAQKAGDFQKAIALKQQRAADIRDKK